MLNAVAVPEDVSLRRSKSRIREVESIIAEVATSFPNIEYELDAASRTANAQAYARVGTRVVRIYGGLAFHPMVKTDALLFTLLHETGHHYAVGRRFANDPMLACDCNADLWAITQGADTLLRLSGRRLDIVKAIAELDAMICSISSAELPVGGRRARIKSQGCWASDWPTRKILLSGGLEIVVARRCRI